MTLDAQPLLSDYPQVAHPWAGTEDGHDCETCGPDSIWKCDRMAHAMADLEAVQESTTPVLQAMQRARRKALDESLGKGLA